MSLEGDFREVEVTPNLELLVTFGMSLGTKICPLILDLFNGLSSKIQAIFSCHFESATQNLNRFSNVSSIDHTPEGKLLVTNTEFGGSFGISLEGDCHEVEVTPN